MEEAVPLPARRTRVRAGQGVCRPARGVRVRVHRPAGPGGCALEGIAPEDGREGGSGRRRGVNSSRGLEKDNGIGQLYVWVWDLLLGFEVFCVIGSEAFCGHGGERGVSGDAIGLWRETSLDDTPIARALTRSSRVSPARVGLHEALVGKSLRRGASGALISRRFDRLINGEAGTDPSFHGHSLHPQ